MPELAVREYRLLKQTAAGTVTTTAIQVPVAIGNRTRSAYASSENAGGAWALEVHGRPEGSGGTWTTLATLTGSGVSADIDTCLNCGEYRVDVTTPGTNLLQVWITGG